MQVDIPDHLIDTCPTCQEQYIRRSARQKYCCSLCRDAVGNPGFIEIIRLGHKAQKEMKSKRQRPTIDRAAE
jgi:ribosomal protein L37AE/L43A